MKTRALGKRLRVTEIGLGCWQFGGDFGPMEEQTAHDIMLASTEAGATFFDTADVYGAGRSETLIGSYLPGFTGKLTVATKFGRDGSVFPDNYTQAELRTAVNAACRRLAVESLDLLQLHCIPKRVLEDGSVFNWLRELQSEGTIRSFGASVETIEEGLLCMQQPGIESLQIIFNIFRQKPADHLLQIAKQKNVGIIVRLPLASGLLAGKFSANTTFPETDHRNYNKDGQYFNVGETFAGLPFAKGVEFAEQIKPLVPEGFTMAQMALRWILDHDSVSCVIPGASSVEQAQMNAAVSELPQLSLKLHKQLRQFYEEQVTAHIRGPY
ncbi:MAG: aldo/keto reductase [Calditrichia bacterium]